MSFNSFQFIGFLVAVLLPYFIAPLRFRWVVLLIASLVFYAWARPVYLALLVATIISTWYSAIAMENSQGMKDRKRIMVATLLLNFGILVVFKYLGFFNELFALLHRVSSGKFDFSIKEFVWPVGISFYTFQSVGYVLDVYFKTRKAERHIGYYALFVSYFPQILSGPIGRSAELLPQIRKSTIVNWADAETGAARFIWGLFKKLVIADRLSVIVDSVYGNVYAHHGMVFWMATILYFIQLYADFSGYTDMAIGVSRIFGIKLAENFDFPYRSKNVTEFWRRWHISLSGWLRDYLYTPLMFSKKKWGKKAVGYALFLTFVICGIWHGARMSFVLFGILQASLLVYEMYSRKWRADLGKRMSPVIYNASSWLLTFTFIVFCFGFLKASTTGDALFVAKNQFTSFFDAADLRKLLAELNYSKVGFTLLVCFSFLLADSRIDRIIRRERGQTETGKAALCGFLLALTLALGFFGETQFIYFRF